MCISFDPIGFTAVFALFAASACVVVSGDDDDAAGSTSTTTAPTTTASTSAGEGSATTSAGTETTGPMIDPEEVCSQITDPKGCQSDSEVYCGWIAPTSVTLDGATCIRDEGEGSCLAVAGPGDTDGCAPTPGCGGQAYFREVDAEIRVVVLCGAAPPVGYEPCTYMEPGVYEPAECGCLCDETDSTSTGPGDESSGSGSSSGTSG